MVVMASRTARGVARDPMPGIDELRHDPLLPVMARPNQAPLRLSCRAWGLGGDGLWGGHVAELQRIGREPVSGADAALRPGSPLTKWGSAGCRPGRRVVDDRSGHTHAGSLPAAEPRRAARQAARAGSASGDRGRGGRASLVAGRIPPRPGAGRRHGVGGGFRRVAAHRRACSGRGCRWRWRACCCGGRTAPGLPARCLPCWGRGAVAGTLVLEGFGSFAVVTVAAAASLPAWLMCAGRHRQRGLDG